MNEKLKNPLPDVIELRNSVMRAAKIDGSGQWCHVMVGWSGSGSAFTAYVNMVPGELDEVFESDTPEELVERVANFKHDHAASVKRKIQTKRAELAKLESELAGKGAE